MTECRIVCVLISYLCLFIGTSPKCTAQLIEPRIDNTKNLLQISLDSYSEGKIAGRDRINIKKLSAYDRYMVLGYQRGLAALDGASVTDFDHPQLLTAMFQSTETIPSELFVIWLCSKESIGGAYVQNGLGANLAEAKVFTVVDPGALEGEKALLRYGFARISKSGEKRVPRLRIDSKHFAGEMRVGLVEKDGRRLKPIPAFVEEKLRRNPPPNRDD